MAEADQNVPPNNEEQNIYSKMCYCKTYCTPLLLFASLLCINILQYDETDMVWVYPILILIPIFVLGCVNSLDTKRKYSI